MIIARHKSLSSCKLIIFLLFFAEISYAGGERTSIAGMSMARTLVASARGMDALGANPANLALGDDNSTVTFTLIPPFALSIGSDFLDYEIYNEYFTGVDTGGTERASKYLRDADKERILSIFPAGIAETHMDIDLRLFAVTIHDNSFGSFGFAVNDKVAYNFDIPRDYARFVLTGLDSAGSSYDFRGTNVRGWWLREYNFSYARILPDLGFAKNIVAGVSVKLLHGYGYIGTERYSATFANHLERDLNGNFIGYRLVGNSDFRLLRSGIDIITFGEEGFDILSKGNLLFPNPAGSGFGLDLGMSGEFFSGINLALSLFDIGSVTWTLDPKEITGISTFSMTNPTSKVQQDSLERAFKGNEQAIGKFSTSLATGLRVGGSLRLDETPWMPWLAGQFLLAFEYEQGFNNAPGNTTRPRGSLGVEYRPIGFFPIRTGISIGGLDRFNWAMGFGFDFSVFTLDVGTENIAILITPKSFNLFSFGLGMKLKI